MMCRNGSACGCGGKGGGLPVVPIVALVVLGALVVFVATHAGILARAAVSFVSVMSIVIWLMWRSGRAPQPVKREAIKHTLIPGRQAVAAAPKAIEGATVVEGSVATYNKTAGKLEVVSEEVGRGAL